MTTKQTASRELLIQYIILAGFWIHAAFLLTMRNVINKDDCSFDARIHFDAVIILEIIGNVFMTIATASFSFILLNYDIDTISDRIDKENTTRFFQGFSFLFYFVNSIITNIAFFKSDYVIGKLETCSNINAEVAYRTYTFSFAWILFLLYAYITIGIIFLFFVTIIIAIKESNIFICGCGWLKKYSCFSSCKRVSPINVSSPNDKCIQTENDIIVPISSLKNEIKPFICIICMVNNIDTIIEPCNHMCMCRDCIGKLSNKSCPCCNKQITNLKNIYVSNLQNNYYKQNQKQKLIFFNLLF